MARIEGVGPRGPFQAICFFLAKRALGAVPESVRVYARHSKLFRGVMLLERAFQTSHTVPERAKVLAELLVATRIGCPY